MKVGCCSITELDKREDLDKDHLKEVIGVWKPIMLVSGDHVKGGSSREWGFEDVEVEKGRVRLSLFLLLYLNLSYTHEC